MVMSSWIEELLCSTLGTWLANFAVKEISFLTCTCQHELQKVSCHGKSTSNLEKHI